MAEPNSEKKLLPPYLSYKTFRNFLDSLKITMPSRIDKSVMPNFSGANQSWLIGTLKYLKLITEDGLPIPELGKLARAEGDERKKILKDIIIAAYPFLFTKPFSLQSATPRQIEEEFNKTAATGETVKKCIAFFLAAAKDANIELSTFLKQMRYTKTTRVPRRNHITSATTEEMGLSEAQPMDWTTALMAKFPTFDPAWPDEVKGKWFDAFKHMMDTMKEREEG